MKYIKSYEDMLPDKYEKGDYVLLEQGGRKWNLYEEVKIVEKLKPSKSFRVEGFNFKNRIIIFWIDKTDIERHLTPDEIDKYESKKQALKYNI